MGRHDAPLQACYSDSESTSLCSYSLMLHADRRTNKYKFYKSTALEVSMLTITPPMPAMRLACFILRYHKWLCIVHIYV
jgi:hypothetical protein